MATMRQRGNGKPGLRRSRKFSTHAVTNLRTVRNDAFRKLLHYNDRVSDAVRIGILGDFNPEFRSHHATNDALQHAAGKLGTKVESQWIPTPSVLEPNGVKTLESFDGIWASPGSPYKSMDGMLRGIQFAR